MALQDFSFGGSIAEPVLAPEESLVLTTQGQILRDDEAVEATFHLSNRRVMASPHYGGDPIELALYAEVESAKLERRSIITGVVTMGNSRILVPQSHGDAFVAAFRAYQDAADTNYPSLRLTKRRDLDAAMSMILSEKRSGSSQEIYLGEMLGRLDLATVNADSLGQAMSRADWLPANYRVATRSAKLMALIGYYTREREIKASRLPESGIISVLLAGSCGCAQQGGAAGRQANNQ